MYPKILLFKENEFIGGEFVVMDEEKRECREYDIDCVFEFWS